ncbi:MAG: peptidylprolyl isomerase [Alphaproteobacteria bacterium]|nr:peptidylprolyl isomerase [Alphaproteobacteria bacterium]
MSVPEPRPIREYQGVDRRTFIEEIRPSGQPAVLRGLAADWPAVQAAKESPERISDYLLSFRPSHDVSVILGAPEIGGRFFYAPDFRSLNFTRGSLALEAFMERLIRDQKDPKPFAMAVQSEPIPELLAGFVQANRIDLLDPGVVPRIWIGNRIQVAPHYDLKENIGIVVAGQRRFTLFPPDQLANLYIGPLEVTPAGTPVSLVDIHEPDLDRFPLYAEAASAAQSAVLEEGDAIYIPFHWWHGVDSLARVNAFVNYWWNDAPLWLGNPYDALIFALYAFRGLPAEQRDVWRTMFDHLVFCAQGDPLSYLPESARGVLGEPGPEQIGRMRATLRQIIGTL